MEQETNSSRWDKHYIHDMQCQFDLKLWFNIQVCLLLGRHVFHLFAFSQGGEGKEEGVFHSYKVFTNLKQLGI